MVHISVVHEIRWDDEIWDKKLAWRRVLFWEQNRCAVVGETVYNNMDNKCKTTYDQHSPLIYL